MKSNKPIDEENMQFQNDLLESVRQMRAGTATSTTVVPHTATVSRTKVDAPKVELKDLQGIAHNAQSTEHRDRSDRT